MYKYILVSLTTVALYTIINLAVKKGKKYFIKVIYTQSSIHQIVKHFIPNDLFDLPKTESQAIKHVKNNTVKVIIIEDQAYWVHDNNFYVADTDDGFVNSETVRPIDTNNMSKRDIDKMLFILDSLKNGNSDDSGSTGNKRF
jgi:hypothetical protein